MRLCYNGAMKTLTVIVLALGLLLGGCAPREMRISDPTLYDTPANYPVISSEHSIVASDGTVLRGWLIEPIEGDTAGTVVVFNGIVSNSSTRFRKWLWVLDAGYELFIFDYRSYGRSEGAFDIDGFIDDVDAGLQYVRERRGKPMIACGQSMGGSLLIDALARKRYEGLKFAVIDSTFSSFTAISGAMMRKSVILFPFSWLPSLIVPTRINAIENVSSVGVPLLFVAGTADGVVDPDNSRVLYEAAAEPKGLWIVEGAGHVNAFERVGVQRAFERLLDDPDAMARPQNPEARIFR